MILSHQLPSESRFFAHFVGTEEPSVEVPLSPVEGPAIRDYIEYVSNRAEMDLPHS